MPPMLFWEGAAITIVVMQPPGEEQMQDRLFIRDYLRQYFDEVDPKEFYRSIFPEGELEEKGKQISGMYNALAVELLPKAENITMHNARKYIITDDLEYLDKLLKSDNFIIISPISYAGRSRQSSNARFIYALTFDLDGITEEHYLVDLLHQIEIEFLPKPTYIVWSGSGLHLYYQFIKPLPCFKHIVDQLSAMKVELTKKIWNGLVSELSDNPQIESLFQGFRLVGGITKGGNRTAAFEYGDKVSIEYLNDFVPEEAAVKQFKYKSKLSLKDAAKKYPEWYDKRIVRKEPKGTWQANRAVYDWWLKQLKDKIIVGHRYYGVMVLAIYAKKCGIDREELEKDAFDLVDYLDTLTVDDENHFTRDDIFSALEMYNESYITFPIDSISALTAIQIQKNKRNHRDQKTHLKRARKVQEVDYPNGEWRYRGGRKPGASKQRKAFKEWRINNPYGSITQCIEETGIGKTTVYRYWKMGVDEL